MKTLKHLFLSLLSLLLWLGTIRAQPVFDLNDYHKFLQTHQNMTAEALYERHPAPLFAEKTSLSWETALYSDLISSTYHLTEDEIALLNKHGFMVSERLRGNTFLEQYLGSIYNSQGRLIKTLVRESLPAGTYLTQWDSADPSGRAVAASVYFYEIKCGGQQFSGKMMKVGE